MKLDQTISILKKIASANQEHLEAIGTAIVILQHYADHGLVKYGRITPLPDSTEAFGYFVVHECDENGELLGVVSDDAGNAIEFLPNSLVMEPSLRPD